MTDQLVNLNEKEIVAIVSMLNADIEMWEDEISCGADDIEHCKEQLKLCQDLKNKLYSQDIDANAPHYNPDISKQTT
jgi:hypothetical protein